MATIVFRKLIIYSTVFLLLFFLNRYIFAFLSHDIQMNSESSFDVNELVCAFGFVNPLGLDPYGQNVKQLVPINGSAPF